MKPTIVLLAVFALIFSACDSQDPLGHRLEDSPNAKMEMGASKRGSDDPTAQLTSIMDAINIPNLIVAEWLVASGRIHAAV